MATLEELQAQLFQMQDKLQLLEAKLEAEKNLRKQSMRGSHRCPLCGGGKIYHAKEIIGGLQGYKLGISTTWIKALGLLGAFICANCGHAEFQVKNPNSIEGRKNIQVLEEIDTSEGPYR